jgi:ribonuclease D
LTSIPPILTTTAELTSFLADLANETALAVDLEADSMHHYQEKVCLLQVSGTQQSALIDPLAMTDLSPLAPVLSDPAVRKYFHAADYDIRCLHRDFGLEVRGLFDTMIASQFLGEEKVGLADMLQKYYGVTLDKKFQRADWTRRPLPEDMARYAAEDTRYLHALGEMLEKHLREAGRLDWVAEEFKLLEAVRHSEHEGPLFTRVKGASRLKPRQLAVLELLLEFRDEEARRRDRPLFKVLGNAVMLEVAREQPTSLRALTGLSGMPARLADRYGKRLVELVRQAQDLPQANLPVFPRKERPVRDPEVDQRMAKLKQWRSARAEELGIDPGVLINNATMEEIARLNPGSDEELAQAGTLKGWQQRELGPSICDALREEQ